MWETTLAVKSHKSYSNVIVKVKIQCNGSLAAEPSAVLITFSKTSGLVGKIGKDCG